MYAFVVFDYQNDDGVYCAVCWSELKRNRRLSVFVIRCVSVLFVAAATYCVS